MTGRPRIGILGGGQLGRMLALAAQPLALGVRVLENSANAPAATVAELHVGEYDHPDALARFADGLDVVTYEFENVPVSSARFLAQRLPVFPPLEALEAAQDRLHEKTLFQRLGLRTPGFANVLSRNDLIEAVAALGLPTVLKTRRLGYDGKGQRVLATPADVAPAWDALGGVPLILERFIHFTRELSLLAVRGRGGEIVFYPLVENQHHAGILRRSRAPAAGVSGTVQTTAEAGVARVLEALHYVGVLAVEFFEIDGQLLANEMAPRVHNSGHWTIEGAETSQFENHIRAVLGWPLGPTTAVGESVMLNLIGTVPEPRAVLAVPGAHLHLYGKEPRPGRKLGHITVRAAEAGRLEELVDRLLPLVES